MSEEPSLREALDAAIDESETQEAGAPPVEETPTPEPPTNAQEAPEEPTQAEAPETETEASAEEERPETDTRPRRGDRKLTEAERIAKAPASWSPALREHWDGIPEDVKKHMHKREMEMYQGLEKAKENRKLGDRFKQVVDSFQPVLAAEGVQDPVDGVKNLIGTVSTLRMGSPQQKAQLMAGLIQTYAIDLNMLDTVLAGNINPQQQPQGNQTDPNIEHIIDQRMAPINQYLQNIQQQQAMQYQKQQEQVNGEVANFGHDKEFFNDVREDMADLIEAAAARGRELSLEDAYEAACQMNPEIRQVKSSRLNTTTMSSKRNAASSISGRQGGAPAANNPTDIRGALSAAWDAAQGG